MKLFAVEIKVYVNSSTKTLLLITQTMSQTIDEVLLLYSQIDHI